VDRKGNSELVRKENMMTQKLNANRSIGWPTLAVAAATFLVLAVSGCAPQADVAAVETNAADHHELIEEVRALDDALTEAILADDIDSMLAVYAEDPISLPNMSPRMDGIEAIRASYDQMSAAGVKILSIETDPTDVWEAGDHVIAIGWYKISLQPPGMPTPIDDKGKFLTVYVRQEDGSLKVKAEITNTDMDLMAMGSGESE